MLQEYTTAGTSAIVHDDESLYSLLKNRLERTGPDTVIASYKAQSKAHSSTSSRWTDITTGEFHTRVLQAAKGLIALGVEPHQSVAIFSSTRLEWSILDFAIAAIGAVTVPIYDTDSASQAQRIINDADVTVAFADTQDRFNKLASIRRLCPCLRQILMIDSNALGALEGLGVNIDDAQLQTRIDTVRADDIATIVYTSGSTGVPQGVELTHRNFLSITRGASEALAEVVALHHPRLLLFLPLAHAFARFIQFASVHSDDGVIGYVNDTRSLLPDLRAFQPTYVLAVPRVFEKIYNAASHKAGMGLKGKLFAQAAEAARVWSKKEQAAIFGEHHDIEAHTSLSSNISTSNTSTSGTLSSDTSVPDTSPVRHTAAHTPTEIAQHALFETLIYRNIRAALGPKIKYVACGGAPLDTDLAHFFNGIGLPMIQGYGLTETAAPFAATRVYDNKIGTVGQPAPGNSVRIADDGELQVFGANVFRGYHNMPEKTAEVMTADGWFKTGDLGSIDDAGRITITGRKKDIIITAGGKNVSPIPLEQTIAQCPLVEHVVVIGDKKPFISALITLDTDALTLWLPQQGFDGSISVINALQRLDANAAIRAEIQEYVNRANATVSRAESVRKFAVLDTHLTQDNGCLTPSMKVVRAKVLSVFESVIERDLYAQ